MLNTIHTKISTTLNELTGSGQPLSVVYEDPLGKNEKYDGFPCAVLALSSFDNQYLTNAENRIGMTYTIYLIQETEIAGMAKAHRILRQTVDDLIAKFATDWDQGTSSEGHRIWWSLDIGNSFNDPDEKVLYYELNLITNLVYNI